MMSEYISTLHSQTNKQIAFKKKTHTTIINNMITKIVIRITNLSVILSQTVDLICDFSPGLFLGFSRHTLVKLPYRERNAT